MTIEPAWSTSALEKCSRCGVFVYATRHFDDGFVCDRCLAVERQEDLESN